MVSPMLDGQPTNTFQGAAPRSQPCHRNQRWEDDGRRYCPCPVVRWEAYGRHQLSMDRSLRMAYLHRMGHVRTYHGWMDLAVWQHQGRSHVYRARVPCWRTSAAQVHVPSVLDPQISRRPDVLCELRHHLLVREREGRKKGRWMGGNHRMHRIDTQLGQDGAAIKESQGGLNRDHQTCCGISCCRINDGLS